MITSLSRKLGVLVMVSGILVFSGCATASKPEAMQTSVTDFSRQNPETVSLNVTGGSETSAAGTSKISNANYRSAVATSIERSKLFAAILVGDASDYQLDILIARLEQPVFGFSMTVTLETNWTLTRKADNKVIWQKAIPTTYTARTGEAFSGVKRLRLANEGAARANIEEALRSIGGLDLSQL